MVLERIFEEKWIEKRILYSYLAGIVFSLLGFVTSYLLFRRFVGLAMILFTVIIALPGVNKLLALEERSESKKKKKSFFKEHESIIDFYIYFFLGVFTVFFVIGLASPQLLYGESLAISEVTIQAIDSTTNALPPPPPPNFELQQAISFGETLSIFQNNLYVLLVAFVLSLFYGAGALFLITLNSSIFAKALSQVILSRLPQVTSYKIFFVGCNVVIMFFHLIPEVASYLLAAIAGGVLSKAFVREKLHSKRFYRVLNDSLLLLIVSVVVLIVAAVIEVELSTRLFTANVCFNQDFTILFVGIVIVLAVIVFEILRKRKA